MFSRKFFPALMVLTLTLIPYGSTQSQSLELFHNWSDYFPATGSGISHIIHHVDCDPSGNVFWAGGFSETLETGCVTRTSRGSGDIFLVKFDKSGVCVWDTIFGDASGQGCSDVTTDPLGNVIIVGPFGGTLNFGGDDLSTGNFYLAKFDTDCNHIWSKEYLYTGYIKCHSITSDPSGNIIITGNLDGTVNFGGVGDEITSTGSPNGDVFLAKFDASGNHDWSDIYGDGSYVFGYDVVADHLSDIIITGAFAGTIDFGDGTRTARGSYDMYLVKFDPSGGLVWARTYGSEPSEPGDEVFGFNLDVGPDGSIFVIGTMEGFVWFGEPEESEFQWVGDNPHYLIVTADPDGVDVEGHAGFEISAFGSPTGGYCDHFDLEVDGAGTPYMAGTYGVPNWVCSIGPPTASYNMFLAQGSCIWGQRFGESEAQCYDIAVSEMGDVVIAGRFETAIDFGGGLITGTGSWNFCLAGFTQNDVDGDGIANEIDVEPTSFSDEFSDIPLGGVTAGRIVDRSWTQWSNPTRITVKDEPAPEGVRCIVDVPRASFNSCGEMAGIDVEDGEYIILTCGSMTLAAGDGPIESLLGPDVSAEVNPGASMEVEALGGGQSEIENLAGSTGSVFIAVGEDTTELVAGQAMLAAIPEGATICQVSTDTLDLGSVHPGYSNEETFVIKNIGASILSGQVLGDSTIIRVDSLPGHHLAAGDSLVVTAYFEPTTLGTYYCEVQTGNDDCGTVILKGTCEYSASIPDPGEGTATESSAYLGACKPNPANSGTLVPLMMRTPGHVRLSLYDARGRLVTELFEGVLEAGTYEIPWNGMTGKGEKAAPGVYLCRMVASEVTDMKRFVVLR
jgi:hypothetical protein